MEKSQIVIAVVVVLVVVAAAAVAYHFKTSASASACPDGGTVGTTPLTSGYCTAPAPGVSDMAGAAAACKADTKCLGYGRDGSAAPQLFYRKI